MMGVKENLLLWFTSFLTKSQKVVVLLIMRLNKIYNQLKNYTNQLLETLKKRAVYSGFKDNIWGVDLADMQSLSKYNKGIKYLLCAIGLFSKQAWVVPIKDKKSVSIVDAFQKLLKEFNRKLNKIWVNKGGEFYNNSFKSG